MNQETRRPLTITLKPCPFCGGPAQSMPWHGGAPTKMLIECTCEVGPHITGETFTEAAKLWNRRWNMQ